MNFLYLNRPGFVGGSNSLRMPYVEEVLYPAEFRERAVRLLSEQRGSYWEGHL